MLNVFVNQDSVGNLFKSNFERGVFYFGYDGQCLSKNAVSLTMPVVTDPYSYNYKHQLHPIFDMNLPEGDLRKYLRIQFSKAVPDFDDLALLKILGKHQIGRLRFNLEDNGSLVVPPQSLSELMVHDGAEGLFESLLDRYAVYSGISGVQPKVMVRDSQYSTVNRITHKDATHIVKTWNPNEFPQLAANEFFCMRAALHAKLKVPHFELSNNAKFLIIERFDLENDSYLGFEDFCVLNAKSSEDKYRSSYENITRGIKEFVSPEQVPTALEAFFKTLTLSCALRNGDAHLKNFGVLYSDTDATISLSPVYDIITTTVYIPNDTLALTLGGTTRWPKANMLIKFAKLHCNLTEFRAQELMAEVAEGIVNASYELTDYMKHNEFFKTVGFAMLDEWNKGLNCSINHKMTNVVLL